MKAARKGQVQQDPIELRGIRRQDPADIVLAEDPFRQSLLVWWQARSAAGFAGRYRVLQQNENKLFTAASVRRRETGAGD